MIHRAPTNLPYFSYPVVFLGLALAAYGQNGGRFDETKRLAQQYLDSDQFDRAAGKLEEIWEQDKTDPVVAELLGIAYLNGDDRRYHPDVADKARKVMEEAIKLGGKATFLVQHKHEGKWVIIVTGGDSLKYCNGKLSIQPGKVAFVMKPVKGATEQHTFEVAPAQLRASGSKSSVFTISRQVESEKGKLSWKNYTMEPRNGNTDDNNLILFLIREHVSGESQ